MPGTRWLSKKNSSKSPTDAVYIAMSSLQKWSIRLKEKDQEHFLQEKSAIMNWLKDFKATDILMSDVCEI